MSASPRMNVLNEADNSPNGNPGTKPADLTQISVSLQKLMLRMKGEYMTDDGKAIRYSDLKTSELYAEYKTQTRSLRDLNLEDFENDKVKTAFFINIYNCLTIDGLVSCPLIPESILNVQQFWRVTAYHIGAYNFSLDDIEHGILRGNRGHPASKTPQFPPQDPRIAFIVQKVDPRIHFALVCGAKSCPAINVYTPKNLESALDAAARSFCAQEVQCHIANSWIRMSKIFQWYREDFGNTDVDAVRWTMQYVVEDIQYGLDMLLERLEKFGFVEIKYNAYDWTLNIYRPARIVSSDSVRVDEVKV